MTLFADFCTLGNNDGDVVETAFILCRLAQFAGVAAIVEQLLNLLVTDHVGQAVAAEHEGVAGQNQVCAVVQVDKAGGAATADAVGDDIGMVVSAQQVVKRMVCRNLLQLPFVQTVETAVAAVHPIEVFVVICQCHQRSAHLIVLGNRLALRIERVVDALQPSEDGLGEVGRLQGSGHVVEEETQVLQHVAAGHFTAIVASHAVGKGQKITVGRVSREADGYVVVSNIPTVYEEHVFIVGSDFSSTAVGRDIEL